MAATAAGAEPGAQGGPVRQRRHGEFSGARRAQLAHILRRIEVSHPEMGEWDMPAWRWTISTWRKQEIVVVQGPAPQERGHEKERRSGDGTSKSASLSISTEEQQEAARLDTSIDELEEDRLRDGGAKKAVGILRGPTWWAGVGCVWPGE